MTPGTSFVTLNIFKFILLKTKNKKFKIVKNGLYEIRDSQFINIFKNKLWCYKYSIINRKFSRIFFSLR